jgi:GNAT superfamily N-acetyltransferase
VGHDARRSIEEIKPPTVVDGRGWQDFVTVTDVRNAAESHAVGHDAFGWHPAELLRDYLDPEHARKTLLVARIDGVIVARGVLSSWTSAPGVHDVHVAVAPEHQGLGIGADLRARLERQAADEGGTTLTAFTMHRPDAVGRVIPSPAGTGEVGADDDAARFVLAAGYHLAQTSRTSALDTEAAADDLEHHHAEAARAAGAAYRVVSWTGPTPDGRLDTSPCCARACPPTCPPAPCHSPRTPGTPIGSVPMMPCATRPVASRSRARRRT